MVRSQLSSLAIADDVAETKPANLHTQW